MQPTLAHARYVQTSLLTSTSAKKPAPFRIEEEGWGEFDMTIVLTVLGKPSETHTVSHDLNFATEEYTAEHPVVSRPQDAWYPALTRSYRHSRTQNQNSSPSSETAAQYLARKTASKSPTQQRNVPAQTRTCVAIIQGHCRTVLTVQFDIEKLAEGLQKLGEDDLLQVVELVHTNKTEDTYTKNDVESESLLLENPHPTACSAFFFLLFSFFYFSVFYFYFFLFLLPFCFHPQESVC